MSKVEKVLGAEQAKTIQDATAEFVAAGRKLSKLMEQVKAGFGPAVVNGLEPDAADVVLMADEVSRIYWDLLWLKKKIGK